MEKKSKQSRIPKWWIYFDIFAIIFVKHQHICFDALRDGYERKNKKKSNKIWNEKSHSLSKVVLILLQHCVRDPGSPIIVIIISKKKIDTINKSNERSVLTKNFWRKKILTRKNIRKGAEPSWTKRDGRGVRIKISLCYDNNNFDAFISDRNSHSNLY